MKITVLVSTSAGVRKDVWDKMSNKEKAAYVAKYPNSKYAKAGKASKAQKGSKIDKKISDKVKGYQINLDWALSREKRDVVKAIADLNKKAGTACKIGKIKARGDNGYPEAFVVGKSKDEVMKFVDAYSDGEAEDYEEFISKVK